MKKSSKVCFIISGISFLISMIIVEIFNLNVNNTPLAGALICLIMTPTIIGLWIIRNDEKCKFKTYIILSIVVPFLCLATYVPSIVKFVEMFNK